MNDDLKGRLLNWKFRSAAEHLEGESEETKTIVDALASCFGNCGWFEGDMGMIVGTLVTCYLLEGWEGG